jgi:hypothetical protein
LVHWAIVSWYVLRVLPSGALDLIVYSGPTQPYDRGLADLFLSVMADASTWLVQRGEHDIEHELIFSRHNGYIFHDSRGMEAGSEDELKIVQDFVYHKSRERRLKDRLHAIWFVRLVYLTASSQRYAFQVLRSVGLCSALARIEVFRGYLPG